VTSNQSLRGVPEVVYEREMKIQAHPTAVVVSIAWLLAVTVRPSALGETKPQASAQALLEEAKQSEFERKLATKQTDLDRLGEDSKKGKMEIEALDRSAAKVGAAANEAKGRFEQFSAERKRLAQELEVVNLRIEAEKLKEEGLKLLVIAHTKAREALSRRTDELGLRTMLVAAEMQHMSGKSSSGPAAPATKKGGSKTATARSGTTDIRKQLEKAEQATINANTNARQAMDAATLKLAQADAAAAKTEKKQTEVSLDRNPAFPGGNDPLGSANK